MQPRVADSSLGWEQMSGLVGSPPALPGQDAPEKGCRTSGRAVDVCGSRDRRPNHRSQPPLGGAVDSRLLPESSAYPRVRSGLWDQESNNVASRRGPVVPLRQVLVKDDGHVVFEARGYLPPSLIDLIDDLYGDVQSLTRVGLFHKLFDQVNTGEDHTLTSPCDMREQAMLDWVVLGSIWGIVSNSYFDPEFIDQLLEVLLEDVMPAAVAPTTVTQEQD